MWSQAPFSSDVYGVVTEAGTGETVYGAFVFIDGTTLRTSSERDGSFRISGVQPGEGTLVVAVPGVAERFIPFYNASPRDRKIDVKLTFGDGAYPTPKMDMKWKDNADRFTRGFFGDSPFLADCEIGNPMVLSFENKGDRLIVKASEPLFIVNMGIGYEFYYFLSEFVMEGDEVLVHNGYSNFEQMKPRGPEEAQRWEENRAFAYYGSLRHFVRSLGAGDTEQTGFNIYNAMKPGTQVIKMSADDMTRRAGYAFERRISFPNFIQVIYQPEGNGDLSAIPSIRLQTLVDKHVDFSWLKIKEGTSLTVDILGRIYSDERLQIYGKWASPKVAELLPIEYEPDSSL